MDTFLTGRQGELLDFTVVRRVIVGQAPDHTQATVPMHVKATSAVEAADLANENKYQREAGLGHHRKSKDSCC